MVRKRTTPKASRQSLNSQLKKKLGIRIRSSTKAGRLELDVLDEDRTCEGICTPLTDEDDRNAPGPPSSDYRVRGYCGLSLLARGSVVVKQTLRTDDGTVSRFCCLTCSSIARVIESANNDFLKIGLLSYPITRWTSGIYALDDSRRQCYFRPEVHRVPAVLSAHFDELSNSNLTMWVLDYIHPEGGQIDWAPYVGVRWSGERTVDFFGRNPGEESVQLNCQLRYTLTASELAELQSAYDPARSAYAYGSALDPQNFHELIARTLLPYLPLAERLSMWDRREDLDALDSGIKEILNESFIRLVEQRACIPLEKRVVLRPEWLDEPSRLIVEPLTQRVDTYGSGDEKWRIVKPSGS